MVLNQTDTYLPLLPHSRCFLCSKTEPHLRSTSGIFQCVVLIPLGWSFCAQAPVPMFQQLISLHSPYLALVPAFQTHLLAVTSVAHRVTKRCLGQCLNHFPAPRPNLAYFISSTVNRGPRKTCCRKNLLHAWYFKDVIRKSVSQIHCPNQRFCCVRAYSRCHRSPWTIQQIWGRFWDSTCLGDWDHISQFLRMLQ